MNFPFWSGLTDTPELSTFFSFDWCLGSNTDAGHQFYTPLTFMPLSCCFFPFTVQCSVLFWKKLQAEKRNVSLLLKVEIVYLKTDYVLFTRYEK